MTPQKRRDAKLARLGHLSLPEIKKLSREVGGGAYTRFGRHERVFRFLAQNPSLLPEKVNALVVGAGAQPPLELELDDSPASRHSKHVAYSYELANSLEHAGKDYAITVADKTPAVVGLINGQRFLLTSDSQASKDYLDGFFPGALDETPPRWEKVRTFHDPGGVDTAVLRRVSPVR